MKNGLAESFLEAVADAEAALGRTIITRAVSVGTHVGASAGMKERLRRGREAVDALDSIVQNAFEGNAVVLAAWNVAKRVKALPGGGRIDASDLSAAQADTAPEAA